MQNKSKLPYVLWAIQVLLALVFLMAGGVKLATPIDPMVKQTGLPGSFLRFVGVCEVLGGFGLVLPGLLRLWTGLTPLAALGLVGIMIGAVTVTVKVMGPALALFPLIVGLLAAFVCYGRWKLAPHAARDSSGAGGSKFQSVSTGS